MDHRQFMKAQEDLKVGFIRLDKYVASAKADLEKISATLEAMDGLQKCWRDEDPGKQGPHWFLVKNYALAEGECYDLKRIGRVEKFWALEIVDDAAAAKLGRRTELYGPADELRPIPLGSLADAKTEKCPHCRHEAAIIGMYQQTEDGPEEDVWQLNLYTLCLNCMSCVNFARQVETLRFF